MSQEKKDAQKEKEGLIKNAIRCTETQEECAKRRKTNCDSMMRKKRLKPTSKVLNTRRQCENVPQNNN